MGKRANGEGSIYQRKQVQWVAVITLGTGKRKYFYCRSQAEAVFTLQHAQQAHLLGTLTSTRNETLETFLLNWLQYKVQPKVRERTYQSYQQIVTRDLLPSLACAAHDQEDRSVVLHLLDHAHHFGGTTYGLHYDATTYALRSAETLINLARNASDRTPLLRQAEGLLATIKEPQSKLRLVGVRTAQAQVAVGLGEYEPAAMYANDAVNVAHEITMTTPLPAILEVYQALRHTSAANEPLTARLGLVLWQHQHL